MIIKWNIVATAALLGVSAAAQQSPHGVLTDSWAAPTYVPHRVYDTQRRRFVDFESMLANAMLADVLFLGEQHDDPGTHRLELATLEGLARRRSNVILALEMFERDAQRSLDRYLSGAAAETDFLAVSRPWPRYRTDYRPLVEFARVWKWPVIASNVPRPFASLVARRGLAGMDSLSAADRAFAARTFSCPRDDYFDRFAKTMGDLSAHQPSVASPSAEEKGAQLQRIYEAQCVKDETMGESIADAFVTAPPRALVVHVNGAFHSDYHLGTAARSAARLKDKRVTVVSFVPVDNLDTVDGTHDRRLGDYIVFTLAPPRSP